MTYCAFCTGYQLIGMPCAICSRRSTSWGVLKDFGLWREAHDSLMSMVLSSPDSAQEGKIIQQIMCKLWKSICRICKIICTIIWKICTYPSFIYKICIMFVYRICTIICRICSKIWKKYAEHAVKKENQISGIQNSEMSRCIHCIFAKNMHSRLC